MTNFTVTGDFSAQGNVTGVVTFLPSTGVAATTAAITNGTFSASVPCITGSYTVVFSQMYLNTVPASVSAFNFTSPSSAVTLPISGLVGPAPTVTVAGGLTPSPVFVPQYVGWAASNEVVVANTTTSTSLVQLTLGTGQLQVGSTFRFQIRGTVQTVVTSGTLTFTPQIGAVAAAQTFVMGTQGANAASPFNLTVDATVRASGASGAYITNGYGRIEFGTPVALTTVSPTTTAVVDTTQPTTTLQIKAAWATANAANSLLVETAVIERLA